MARTTQIMSATPEQISAVLSDGWNYADWVVGAVHIRDVDPQWPAVGARVHHRVGAWPFTVADSTEVVGGDGDGHLVLQARLWPFGEALVDVSWLPVGPGSTRVTMDEQFVAGPLLSLRNKVNDLVLHQRNRESLRRLEDMTRRYPASTVQEG